MSLTLKDKSRFGIKSAIDINNLSQEQLVKLRTEIDSNLSLDINEMDLHDELSLQYRQAKALYTEVKDDSETPANQKAQVLNTISSILTTITKTISEVYSIERHKKIEAATLAAVRDLPEENKKKFFDMLKDYLEDDLEQPTEKVL